MTEIKNQSNVVQTACKLIELETISTNENIIKECLQECINHVKHDNLKVVNYTKEDLKSKYNVEISPFITLSNADMNDLDILSIAHIDVVPGTKEQFTPKIKEGKLYGRGSLDMKGTTAVCLELLKTILNESIDIKYGILITSDEETGGQGAYFAANNLDINAKILLDTDIGGDISKIAYKCKSGNFITLTSQGEESHGSLPWDGFDAVENLITSVNNIRKHIPYYSNKIKKPENTWIDTFHVGTIKGGSAANVIAGSAEAELDIRLTGDNANDYLDKVLKESLVEGVSIKDIEYGVIVNVEEKNKYLQHYKTILKNHLKDEEVELIIMGGATDARNFAIKGIPLIMHSISGHGMHMKNEYCVTKTLDTLYSVHLDFIKNFKNI